MSDPDLSVPVGWGDLSLGAVDLPDDAPPAPATAGLLTDPTDHASALQSDYPGGRRR